MQIRYYIDPETKQPHIYNHGVSEDEVEEVLRKPGEDRPGREGSRVSIGQGKKREVSSCHLCPGSGTRKYFCNNSL